MKLVMFPDATWNFLNGFTAYLGLSNGLELSTSEGKVKDWTVYSFKKYASVSGPISYMQRYLNDF